MAEVHDENHGEKKNGELFFFPTIFWVNKQPRHSQNIFAKKRYTSIVARFEKMAKLN